ncbi:MAG: Holliday junction resolvase RuvX, partial [Verrucomicrobiota bacterium]
RILGIDYGSKRMGYALSDPSAFLASSLTVKEYQSQKEVLRFTVELCREHEVTDIVIGWPRNMDGSLGPSAEAVDAFLEALSKRIDLPAHKWDERLSTKAAENVLIEAGTRRNKRKQVVDKMAAQIILQGFLDARG